MSTPNPLIPQGTFQAQAARGASNVRIAVATIVAIHVVFFGGLLMQGCKRDTQTAQNTPPETNEVDTNVSLALPPLDTNSLYYSSQSSLPTETGTAATSLPPQDTNPLVATPATHQSPESLWQATNLNSPIGGGTAQGPGSVLNNTGALSAGTKEYTVVARDTLGKIAKQHGTTVDAILAANPNVEPRRIRPGDKLLVPEGSAPSAQRSTETGPVTSGASANGGSTTTYTVVSGDNLTRIANAHGVSIGALRAANNLKTSRINVGQKLKIPARQRSTQASNGPANNPSGL